MTHKYEKVEGMTVGQVVDAALSGEQLYRVMGDSEKRFDFEKIDIFTLSNWLDRGCVYRKIETPWWEKHVGGLVMTRDSERDNWCYDRLISVRKGWYECDKGTWNQARPLTAAEKEAIITKG